MKPVAWMGIRRHGETRVSLEKLNNDDIPLYTLKELTDEEIMEVATINLGHSMGLLNWMGFARAILRKAQEK